MRLNYRPPEPLPVFVDAEQIGYALDNLLRTIARDLGNAILTLAKERLGWLPAHAGDDQITDGFDPQLRVHCSSRLKSVPKCKLRARL